MTATVTEQEHQATGGRGRVWLVPAALALVIVALVGGLLLGRGATDASPAVTDAVAVGFLRDMKVHHAQAVRMSEIVHRRSADPEVNYLAFDILSTQQGQIGIMTGWLDLSRQSQSGRGPAMAWMGHEGPMPGMATDEQVEELKTLPVPEMERQYLRLMTEHHRGALPMADHAAEHADHADVAALAAGMSAGQAAEIDLMQDLLAARAGGSAPEGASEAHEGH